MDDLIVQIKQAEKMMEIVSPLLVVDDWHKASGQMSELFKKLTEILTLLMNYQNQLDGVEISQVLSIFERLIYAMQMGDTIQLADILNYELHYIFQDLCEQGERV